MTLRLMVLRWCCDGSAIFMVAGSQHLSQTQWTNTASQVQHRRCKIADAAPAAGVANRRLPPQTLCSGGGLDTQSNVDGVITTPANKQHTCRSAMTSYTTVLRIDTSRSQLPGTNRKQTTARRQAQAPGNTITPNRRNAGIVGMAARCHRHLIIPTRHIAHDNATTAPKPR